MKGLRKILVLVLAVSLVFTMAGCKNSKTQDSKSGTAGNTSGGSTTADQTKDSNSDLKDVELTIWSCGTELSAQKDVLDAFCKKYYDKLHVTKINYYYAAFGDYEDKMVSLLASGDNFDACYASDWILYQKIANNGSLLGLNDLIQQNAPTLYKEYQDAGYIGACSVGGELVALPWTRQKSSKATVVWRQDLADKYGVNTTGIETIEDLDAMLKDAAAKIPDITIFESGFPRGNTQSDVVNILAPKYGYDMMNYHMLTFDLKSDAVKLLPIEQTDMFKEAVTYLKSWYDGGIISKNELSVTDTDQFKNGKTFCRVALMEDALAGMDVNVDGAKVGYAELYKDGLYRYDSPLNNAVVINKNAANPERFLKLLELLDTDEEAYDLFMYGVEGKTYQYAQDKSITYVEGQDSANNNYLSWFCWPYLRTKYVKPSGKETAEYYTKIGEWLNRNSLVTSPLVAFNPDTDDIKTELSQRDQCYDEYGKLLLTGVIKGNDVNSAIEKYIEQQKEAGLDKILAYLQPKADEMAKK